MSFSRSGSLVFSLSIESQLEKKHWKLFTTSKYSGDLNTKLVRYSNGKKEVGCQMVRYLNVIWIKDSLTIWILDKWAPYCTLMCWFGIQIFGQVQRTLHMNRPFEYPTFEINTSKSLASGIQMVGIQTITVHQKTALKLGANSF